MCPTHLPPFPIFFCFSNLVTQLCGCGGFFFAGPPVTVLRTFHGLVVYTVHAFVIDYKLITMITPHLYRKAQNVTVTSDSIVCTIPRSLFGLYWTDLNSDRGAESEKVTRGHMYSVKSPRIAPNRMHRTEDENVHFMLCKSNLNRIQA